MKESPDLPHYWMIFLTVLQLLNRACGVFAILFLPPSIVTALSGSKILFNIIFGKFLLKKKILKKDIITIILAILGTTIIGFSAFAAEKPEKTGETNSNFFLLIVGLSGSLGTNIIGGLIVAFFEKVMKKREISVNRFSAIGGSYGLLIPLIFCLIVSFIPCPTKKLCEAGGFLDDPLMGVIELFSKGNGKIMFYAIFEGFCLSIYSFSVVYLAKEVTGAYMVVTKTLSSISVWFFSFLFGFESFGFYALSIEVLGFFVILVANFVYIKGMKKEREADELNGDETEEIYGSFDKIKN